MTGKGFDPVGELQNLPFFVLLQPLFGQDGRMAAETCAVLSGLTAEGHPAALGRVAAGDPPVAHTDRIRGDRT